MSLQAELEEKYRRYLETLGRALSTLRFKKGDRRVEEVVSLAQCYREDAKHFHEKGMHATALVSLAYGEGLLDALRILGLVEFEWGGGVGEEG